MLPLPLCMQNKAVGHVFVDSVFWLARFLIASAYFLLYIYTPMLLPTQVCALMHSTLL